MALPDGHAFVAQRSRQNARVLLAAARRLGYPASVVRATDGGYVVPEQVAEEAHSELHAGPGPAIRTAAPDPRPSAPRRGPGAAPQSSPAPHPGPEAPRGPDAPEVAPEGDGADDDLTLSKLDTLNYGNVRRAAIRLGVGGTGSKAEMVERIRAAMATDQDNG